ncbi:MAG: GTP cyclohydrolase I FolE [Sulfobacillus sp.]
MAVEPQANWNTHELSSIESKALYGSKRIDTHGIEEATRALLLALGEDINREGLRDTPRRVARMYEEICSGLHANLDHILAPQFQETLDGLVSVKNIKFYSLCEHHLLPFFGQAHITYDPRPQKVVGLSKLARLVETVSRRPQVQERMTQQIVDALWDQLHPKGIRVVIEAEHLCMAMRGVQQPGAVTTTVSARGSLIMSKKVDASHD